MKKSFKKAGAAVLSMAMIMAMGAISMPVYAATPGSVTVSIPGAFRQGEGDSQDVDQDLYEANPTSALKYDYLDLEGITSAKVGMYQVAELTGTGWKWSEFFDEQAYRPTANEGFTSFEDLLQQLGGNDAALADNFVYSSSKLQKLASYLERVIRNLKTAANEKDDSNAPTTAAREAKAKLDSLFKQSATLTPTQTSVTIPGNTSTMNKIGWYLLMTETNESGVVIQPVLVSLKNGDQNPIKASLKGTKIRIDKSIVDVQDRTDTVSNSNDTAVIAKEETATYQIKAQLPTYDSLVQAPDITPFVIDDTADPGIKMVESTLKVYLSEDGVLNLDDNGDPTSDGKDYLLTAGADKDYTYTMKANGNGFIVRLTGAQINGTAAVDSTLDDITSGDPATRVYETMQGMYIIVRCDATVNEKWTDEEVATAVAAKVAETTFTAQKADWIAAHPEDTSASDAVIAEKMLGYVAGDYKFNRKYSENGYIDASHVTKAQFDAVQEDEVISAINRGVYTSSELAVGAFTNDALAAANVSFVDVMKKKQVMVNETLTDVYLTAANVETYDPDLAAPDTSGEDGLGKYGDRKRHAEVVDISGLRNRVRVLLARDKANNQNGNGNTATMTYGNVYSTGGGEAHDTDSTKLFSVDVNFDKYTDKLELTSGATEITTAAQVITWLGLTGSPTADEIATKMREEIAGVATVPDTTDYSELVTAVTNAANDATTALTEGEAKKVASLIKAYNDSLQTVSINNGDSYGDQVNTYASDIQKKPVQNAAFKLSRVDDPTDMDHSTRTVIGYAASDANGDLRVLTESTAELYEDYIADGVITGEHAGEIILKITEGTGDDAVTKYWSYRTDSENAWKMLTIGTYEIEEVYAPAGYKKYNGVSTFTIACAEDALSQDYTGEFSGESGSDLFRNIEERKNPNKTTVIFTFDRAKGELQNDIYNELADTLPATGGMGTVLFTAGGIAVILMAGALFVVYMKKRNAEEEE